MPHDLLALTITAATIAFFHSLLAPYHYLPFIAMGRAGSWSRSRTLCIAALCGSGHVLGSVILGVVGIGIGAAVSDLEVFESARENLSAWALLFFGIVYTAWGLRKGLRPHAHSHAHAHPDDGAKSTPWVLFTIFILDPCAPLIPILMVPALQHSLTGVIWVVSVFAVVTLVTMVGLVFVGLVGIDALPELRIQRFSHAVAGIALSVCGILMVLEL